MISKEVQQRVLSFLEAGAQKAHECIVSSTKGMIAEENVEPGEKVQLSIEAVEKLAIGGVDKGYDMCMDMVKMAFECEVEGGDITELSKILKNHKFN